MNEPLLCVREVSKHFEEGRVRALDSASFDLSAGEFVALMGPSGSGKSTLLHLIAALERPDAGDIQVNGHWLSQIQDLDAYRARTIGLVFQLHNLLPGLTALENVEIPMLEMGLSMTEQRKKARRLLELVGLGERQDSTPPKLSGGERQRVAIARALANDPVLLLADEPTGNLDSDSGAQVLRLLHEVRSVQGTTVLLVTHDLEVAQTAERIIFLRDGRITREERLRERAASHRSALNRPSRSG